MSTPSPRPVVTLPYAPLEHYSQVYAGFQELERLGVVTLRWQAPTSEQARHDLARMVLRATVDGVSVAYDVNDGVNAYGPDREENLRLFAASDHQGWYFKRAHDVEFAAAAPAGCTVEPLGVNYYVRPAYVPGARRSLDAGQAKEALRAGLARLPALARRLGIDTKAQDAAAFEAGPALRGPHRAMLFTRLWDPAAPDAVDPSYAADRERINAERIELLRRLRAELGDRFTGGLSADEHAVRTAPRELLLPAAMTQKDAYLAQVRETSVCVATRGLHRSTGWRFGEYVAASRAVVTERLAYDPGPALAPGRNYLEFDTVDEGVGSIVALLDDPDRVTAMSVANRRAYDLALRPDALVLRTLLIALGHGDPVA